MVRSLAARILRLSGYRVIEAGSGPEALALPESEVGSIDLLITDVVMPGKSGRELATRLAGSREAPLILFISGYAPDAIMPQGTLDPGTSFLQKPFSPAQLTARVDEILSAR